MTRSILFSLTAVLCALGAPANAAPLPTDVGIRDVIARGSGCPAGTTDVYLGSSVPGGPADLFIVLYDDFDVEKGPGVPLIAKHKTCTLLLVLDLPPRYRFRLTEVYYEGYASLPAGTSGVLQTDYFYPFGDRISTSKALSGPFTGAYWKDDTRSTFSSLPSACGGSVPLNLKSALTLDGPSDDAAYMSVSLGAGRLVQVFRMMWEDC